MRGDKPIAALDEDGNPVLWRSGDLGPDPDFASALMFVAADFWPQSPDRLITDGPVLRS
jgi:hypothetical protein